MFIITLLIQDYFSIVLFTAAIAKLSCISCAANSFRQYFAADNLFALKWIAGVVSVYEVSTAMLLIIGWQKPIVYLLTSVTFLIFLLFKCKQYFLRTAKNCGCYGDYGASSQDPIADVIASSIQFTLALLNLVWLLPQTVSASENWDMLNFILMTAVFVIVLQGVLRFVWIKRIQTFNPSM